jgi:hypothetical protein
MNMKLIPLCFDRAWSNPICIKSYCHHVRGRGEVHTGFWWGDLWQGDHLEDPGVDGRIILKWVFKK